MTRRDALFWLSGAAAAALLASAGRAETVLAVRLRKLMPHLDRYRALPPERRDAFRLAHFVRPIEGPAAAVSLVIPWRGARLALPLDAEGRVTEPPEPALYAANPMVEARLAAGAFGLAPVLAYEPSEPLAATMSAKRLTMAVAQGSELLRKTTGVLTFIVPAFNGVVLEWDGSAPEADAIFADGRRLALPVEYDRAYFMPLSDKALRGADELVFGRPPLRATLAP